MFGFSLARLEAVSTQLERWRGKRGIPVAAPIYLCGVSLIALACSTSSTDEVNAGDGGAQGGQSGGAGANATAGSSGSSGRGGAGGSADRDAGSRDDGGTLDSGLDAGFDEIPLDFGQNVLIFDPSMPMATIQNQIDAVFAGQGSTQFSTERRAFLFKPGQYDLDVRVGYYTQALGLGELPDSVLIRGAVRSTGNMSGNATLSFWRAAENLSVMPPAPQANMWAVSQGASFRRMHVLGSLNLADSGNSSGGFLANSKIDGQVTSGSQQQWLSRNSEWSDWLGGVWNMVFVGVTAPPAGDWPASPYTVIEKTPRMEEKPFLCLDADGEYAVMVPSAKLDSQGTGWSRSDEAGTLVSIHEFYVAHPEDSAARLNAALAYGKHLLLTPGIYHLESSLQVMKPGTIVLGLGMATLVPDNATPAISIADVDQVKVAGIIIDAGPNDSATLLEVGPPGSALEHAAAPTYLYDISCRVGGGSPGMTSSCVTLNSHDVVGDNLWLWRADHGMGAGWSQNLSYNGLIVNGANVTLYGLFAEHFQAYQTLWNGNGGRVYFYQSELPYDPPSQDLWQHGGVNGYASYKVADDVTSHEAWGLGIYSAFRHLVVTDNAIEAPLSAGVGLRHLVTVWLNGTPGSAINHVINGMGDAATQDNRRVNLN